MTNSLYCGEFGGDVDKRRSRYVGLSQSKDITAFLPLISKVKCFSNLLSISDQDCCTSAAEACILNLDEQKHENGLTNH